jgi:phytoene synthase
MNRAAETWASYRACERIARREARNFFLAFMLLPPDRRRAMCALYAFMRQTDDIADGEGELDDKRIALAEWKRLLETAVASVANRTGNSLGDHQARSRLPGRALEIMPALADAVRRYEIPVEYLREVIDGVSGDMGAVAFETFEELRAYCYRVASVVGISCMHIWGYRSEAGEAERLADACGVALQLTNILRDVREDAARGRVYLPIEDLVRYGVEPHELRAARPGERLRELLEFQGARAYEFYRRGAPLVRLVAPVGRPVLRTIVGVYRALLDEIASRGYDVFSKRVAVPGWKKASIAVWSLAENVV